MVNLYFDYVTDEIIKTAQFISRAQKNTVKLHTPTVTLEVRYEEEKAERKEGNQSQASESR